MFGGVWSIRRGVAVVCVDNSDTVVLDVANGHQVQVIPSAGGKIGGVCVFEGLANDRV